MNENSHMMVRQVSLSLSRKISTLKIQIFHKATEQNLSEDTVHT
jgi:hypothetical protein